MMLWEAHVATCEVGCAVDVDPDSDLKKTAFFMLRAFGSTISSCGWTLRFTMRRCGLMAFSPVCSTPPCSRRSISLCTTLPPLWHGRTSSISPWPPTLKAYLLVSSSLPPVWLWRHAPPFSTSHPLIACYLFVLVCPNRCRLGDCPLPSSNHQVFRPLSFPLS